MKAVNPDLAQSINAVRALLKRDFGSDFSFSIHGNGEVIAQSNILFSQAPIPLRQPSCAQCFHFRAKTEGDKRVESEQDRKFSHWCKAFEMGTNPTNCRCGGDTFSSR